MIKLRVSAHQPNFIPWLPFFMKMAMSDHLLLLANVQFEKNGYQNRFKYKDKLVTKPVHKGNIPIWDKEYIGIESSDTEKTILNMNSEEIEYPSRKWSGGSLYRLNKKWIEAIATTLNIDTKIWTDSPSNDSVNYESLGCELGMTATGRLIKKLKELKSGAKLSGDITYITNPEAKDKYLDEDLMKDKGINIEYCIIPKHLQIHTFEAFEKWGISGTIKHIEVFKDNLCRV